MRWSSTITRSRSKRPAITRAPPRFASKSSPGEPRTPARGGSGRWPTTATARAHPPRSDSRAPLPVVAAQDVRVRGHVHRVERPGALAGREALVHLVLLLAPHAQAAAAVRVGVHVVRLAVVLDLGDLLGRQILQRVD